MSAEIILPLADTHIGSKLGLLPPDLEHFKQNKWQRYTWKCWEHMLSLLPEHLAAVIFMDEMMDGPEGRNHKYGTLITDPGEQREVTVEVLRPIAERADEKWVLIGSDWHIGEWGKETKNLAKDLGAEIWTTGSKKFPDRAGYNLLWMKGGVVLDFAHSRSVVEVNKSMPLEREMRYRLIDNPLPKRLRGKAIVQCIVRAHAHDCGAWFDRHGWSIGVPCWQGMYFNYGTGKRTLARIWKDIGWLTIGVDPSARHPVWLDDYELYDYPKLDVWNREEKRWISHK